MEYSINLNDEKTAKLVFYKEKDKLRIDIMNYENVGSDRSILLYAIYLDVEEMYKLGDIIDKIRYEINQEKDKESTA